MRKLKSLLLCIVVIMCNSNYTYANNPDKWMPSGSVVEMSILLKRPYVAQSLDIDEHILQEQDIIQRIIYNEKEITSLEQMYELMKLENEIMEIEYLRNGRLNSEKISSTQLRSYRLKDIIGCAGTITAIDKKGNFIGIAHSLKLNNTKVNIEKGVVFDTSYVQEVKSIDGNIGSLITNSSSKKLGTIDTMTDYGLQGEFSKKEYKKEKAIEISKPKKGKAYILCQTPISNEIRMHEIEITKVGKKSSYIKIIDESLIKYRGGGVVGMSGSPIIQDNKLVGGFSHVVKKDTTKGKIANIESMLGIQ